MTQLLQFLHEVSLLEDRNKMSASNLAIVITPNVVSSRLVDSRYFSKKAANSVWNINIMVCFLIAIIH